MKKIAIDVPLLLAALVTLVLAGCKGIGKRDAPEKPLNVLFLAVDDLRPELGCYGAEHVISPNIDRLAREGLRFERAYCQSAVCNPSRASLMTGKRPDTIRVWDLRTDLREVCPDVLTLPQHFRRHGYYTSSIGKIYHNIFPDEPSWDERVYLDGFPFDPDAVYLGQEGRSIQEAKKRRLIEAGRGESAKDRLGHYYLKAQATEAPQAPDDDYYDGAQTTWAVRKLAELKEAGRPFFLGVGYYRPHLPFNAPEPYWDLYDRAALPLAENDFVPRDAPGMAINNMRELRGYTDFRQRTHPAQGSLSEAEARRLKHGYLASVSYVDAQVGRLLDALDELGLAENTIVILWGDHGWKLGEHNSWGKMTNYEIDTRVPLLVKAPGHGTAGRSTDRLVELVDLFPTLCELCDVPVPQDLEGASLIPLLADPQAPGKTAVFSQYLREGIWVGPDGLEYMGRAIRTESHRYVEWHQRETGERAGVELYDLRLDPLENENVAGRAENRALLGAMQERLRAGWRAALPSDSTRRTLGIHATGRGDSR